jgi:flavin-dependent dehydrogenase
MTRRTRYDVAIIGAGQAGLSLARQLLLNSDKTILHLDKRAELPGPNQKVGESLVQAAGFYLCKVLDLQEHLLVEHFLKYNLRFHWKTSDGPNTAYEEYCSSFIRLSSNIPTFQVDRNVLESHLLKLNESDPRYELVRGAKGIQVDFSDSGDHRVTFEGGQADCGWIVDASGRSAFLKRKLGLSEPNMIKHGSTWCWVEGVLDVERLTGRSRRDVVFDARRRKTGHMPFMLATNHFCDEGMWLWIIPLHGLTSIGLVFDHQVLNPNEVSDSGKLVDFICRKWPLFQRDLPHRRILDEGRYVSYSYDAKQTISAQRWAMAGESGRFSDPLYSPGADLITILNLLIGDAIVTEDPEKLSMKCKAYEQAARAIYESYLPSYSLSYNCLGDQEAFTLKYTWELAVYFGFFVVPVINDLFTNMEFMPIYLRKFALLGRINHNLQKFLAAFYEWKKASGRIGTMEPVLVDFYSIKPLRDSEKLFYEVGLSPADAESLFDMHIKRLREFARYILAHIHAVVLEDPNVLRNASFVSSLKLRDAVFDPDAMRASYAAHAGSQEVYAWNLNPFALEPFLARSTAVQEACR